MLTNANQKNLLFQSKNLSLLQKIPAQIAIRGLILGILLLAFGVRLYTVTTAPTQWDEKVTIRRYVPLPVVDTFKTQHSNNHPLSAALGHIFSPQADNLFLVRWPSVLMGMLSLAIFYRFGTRLFGQKVGILTLLLTALAPVHIGYSIISRGYIGFVALTTTSFYFLWRAVRHNLWRDWFGFAILNIIVIYFHLFGVLSAGMALGSVSLWVFVNFYKAIKHHNLYSKQRLQSILIKLGIIILLLISSYATLVSSPTNSVFSEGGYLGEFEVWRNGFSWPEDLWPIGVFMSLMSPMAPNFAGIGVYTFFWIIGIVVLWYRQPILALLTVIWFVAPFIVIFIAMQILGTLFYAYSRFLLYLFPAFLLFVALGIVTIINWLSSPIRKLWWIEQRSVQIVKWGIIIGLVSLMIISLDWYLVRTAHTDWVGMAQKISHELQPQDIVICEERIRTFEPPDRAKPHCIWMLDFYIAELTEYTPRFQSSTDFIANYDHLQEYREMMVEAGGVWLILWQKIHFHPGILISKEKAVVESPLPLTAFEPYPAWHIGSATLIYINLEETLFDNVYKSIELLLQIEQSPAARARSYRNLAEMEAVRGHTRKAREFFQKSWSMIEQAGGQYPELYLSNTQTIMNRLPDNYLPPESAVPLNHQIGPSLCLQAYEISPTMFQGGQSVTLTLYWETLDFMNENYTFSLQFYDKHGQAQGAMNFRPFNDGYPTPWWWRGQRLVDHHEFVIPVDLSGQDYIVQLSAYDISGSSDEITFPLLSVIYQPDEAEVVGWRSETIPSLNSACP